MQKVKCDKKPAKRSQPLVLELRYISVSQRDSGLESINKVHATTAMGHREAFEKFIQKTFLDQKKAGSKVMTRSRGAEVTAFLTGATPAQDAHFKFWVKYRGFRLMEYPALGLKNVLCLPAKKN